MYLALLRIIRDRGNIIDIVSPTITPMMDGIHIKDTVIGAVAQIRSSV